MFKRLLAKLVVPVLLGLGKSVSPRTVPNSRWGMDDCFAAPNRGRGRSQRRRGVEGLEVVVAIPILLVATLVALPLGLVLVVQNVVTAAAIEGAREAAKDSVTPDQVASVVAQHLAVHQTELSPTGGAWLRVEGGAAAGDTGNPLLACLPRGNIPDSSQVRATSA